MPLPTTAKTFGLNALYLPLVPFFAWLSVPAEEIAILAILLIIDYFTGVLKVFILKGDLRSYRAIAGMLSKGSILLLVFALAFMAKGIGLDFKLYLALFISALIISETYSIFGNVYSCWTKEDVEEFDAVSMVLKKVRSMIERLLILNRDKL